jgi:hypothetical protein
MTEEFRDRVIKWIDEGCKFEDAVPLLNEAIENTFYRDTLLKRGARKDNIDCVRYELVKAAKLNKKVVKELPDKKRDIKPKQELKPVKPLITPEAKETAGLIRKTFPFLNEADCPDKFKILVADMISAYYRYVAAHKRLFDCKDNDECYSIASEVMENYIQNRESWDELKHYQKHRKILGVNKLFKIEVWEREIKAMQESNLYGLYDEMKHITNRIWRNKKAIQDQPESSVNEERQARIADYEIKLEMIKKQLKL